MEKKTKCCAKCKTEKPLSEFGVRYVDKDVLQSWCKECFRVDNRARRLKRNPDLVHREAYKTKTKRRTHKQIDDDEQRSFYGCIELPKHLTKFFDPLTGQRV